ncbi:hypothetical protein FACS189413_00520 [Bacteroidia bacterium]|nr:hypothetical protein FACS189463_0160 [Bacteroidia bacterium]GHU66831.1 hypothetical protein FACS189413_00520 [Bacteroidia bacterium]
MILAMLYCLDNKIKFVLYSKDANFGYDKGWTDYFLPFCEEETGHFHHKQNPSNADWKKKIKPQILIYHLFHKNTYLTFELFPCFRGKTFVRKQFDIPELGIKGGLREALPVLVDLTWKYNQNTQNIIDQLTASLHLPEHYIGFHIRSGDKYTEAELLNVSDYVEKAEEKSILKNAFVLTDNYEVINHFHSSFNDWDISTLCNPNEKGYFHKNFIKQSKEHKKKQFETFFASMEILNRANIFIGTFSSNLGLFLGVRRPKDTSFGVDSDDCLMWIWQWT